LGGVDDEADLERADGDDLALDGWHGVAFLRGSRFGTVA
jgi:hypothetical protein